MDHPLMRLNYFRRLHAHMILTIHIMIDFIEYKHKYTKCFEITKLLLTMSIELPQVYTDTWYSMRRDNEPLKIHQMLLHRIRDVIYYYQKEDVRQNK